MPEDVRLTRTEKNAIFIMIEESGLSPAVFTWKERRHEEPVEMFGMTCATASVLLHPESDYFYTFGNYCDSCSPGGYERIERQETFKDGVKGRWNYRHRAVKSWLERLKEELDAPDLWGKLFEGKALAIRSALTPPTARFTQEQVRSLSFEFRRIEQRTADLHELTVAQKEAMHEGFEEIKAEMNRFGIKDWVNLACGLLFNVLVGAAFAPNAAFDLYNSFAAAVSPLLDATQRLIP